MKITFHEPIMIVNERAAAKILIGWRARLTRRLVDALAERARELREERWARRSAMVAR